LNQNPWRRHAAAAGLVDATADPSATPWPQPGATTRTQTGACPFASAAPGSGALRSAKVDTAFDGADLFDHSASERPGVEDELLCRLGLVDTPGWTLGWRNRNRRAIVSDALGAADRRRLTIATSATASTGARRGKKDEAWYCERRGFGRSRRPGCWSHGRPPARHGGKQRQNDNRVPGRGHRKRQYP
jgi:hypothetical protein